MPAIALAVLDLSVQVIVIVLGFALLFSPDVLVDGFGLAEGQQWHDLAFALPLAMLAYTGLETVANLSEEARDPGRTLPRALFPAIGLVVVLTALIGAVGITALPVTDGRTALGEKWLNAPIIGIVSAFDGELPSTVVDMLRVAVGLSGALLLLAAASAAISGCTRLAHSLGEHGMLPREFGRLERRALVSSEAILATGAVAIVIVIASSVLASDESTFLASTYSFGVTLAFTVAQLAILRLRRIEPELPRPFLARPEISVRGTRYPIAAIVGAPLTFMVFVLAVVTHPGARYAGPAWLAIGLVIFLVVRIRGRRGVRADVGSSEALPPGAGFRRVLVPMKLGDIGEEMVATAVALAKERGATVEAIYVAAVPRELALDRPLPPEVQARADASLQEARALGEDNDVEVATATVAARSIGHAIVEEAVRRDVDLIVLGSSPRWRRQSRFFSPPSIMSSAARRARFSWSRSPRACSTSERAGQPLRYPEEVKAVVIGCGRVGSAVARQLAADGWEVTVVDKKEDALGRLGPWQGEFVVGHGMDIDILTRAGIEGTDAAVIATSGDNTNIVIGQVVQKRFGVGCVVVRVLDPARADFYAKRGLRTVCPTQTAISVLIDAVRASDVRPLEPSGAA